MKKIDKKTELVKKLQEELERRTRIEEEAIHLIGQCEFEKAQELLKEIDDSRIKEIEEELDRLDQEPEAAEEKEELKAVCEHVGQIITDFLFDIVKDLVIETQSGDSGRKRTVRRHKSRETEHTHIEVIITNGRRDSEILQNIRKSLIKMRRLWKISYLITEVDSQEQHGRR